MKKRKIGISLIVLVITIVVVVVLATAVILSISRNNPIENAKKATFLNDMTALKDELSMYLHQKMIETSSEYDSSSLNFVGGLLYENGNIVEDGIKKVLPSIKDKYKDKVEIQNGKLQYADTNNMEEYNWAKESLEGVSSNLDKVSNENSSVVEIPNATEGNLENLKIYGNTTENGSVGDELKNLFNMRESINGTTIIDEGDGTLKVTGYPVNTSKKLSQFAPKLKVGDKITFSIKTTGYTSIYLYNRSTSFNTYFNNGGTYTITQEMLDSIVYLYGKNDSFEIISGIQIEYGEKATKYQPYDEAKYGKYRIPITICGKNLFNMMKGVNKTSIIKNEDGTITSTLYPATTNEKLSDLVPSLKVGDRVVFTIKTDGYPGIYLNKYGKSIINNQKIDITQNMLDSTVFYYSKSESQGGGNSIISGIQIEYGENATEYEPYYERSDDIYLDEPLRKKVDAVDYIDLKQGKVVRKLETPKIESIDLPDIITKSGTNILTVGTNVSPSKIEAIYNTEK